MLKDALQESTQDRLAEMMTNAMGAAIGDLLHDPSVEELRANPDGRLWCVRDGMRHDTKKTLGTAARRQLINIVAHAVGVTVDEDNPSFPAELPESGYRFHAVVPPQSPDGPTFVIRKKPSKVFSLDDYVAAGIMTGEHAAFIRQGRRESRKYPGRWRHRLRQDDAGERDPARDRSHCRAGAYRRGYVGAAGRSR